MNTDREWKILQIIPAQPGWRAVYVSQRVEGEDDTSDENSAVTEKSKVEFFPVVCWALVEETGSDNPGASEIRGVLPGRHTEVADDWIISDEIDKDGRDWNSYLMGYRNPEQTKEAWVESADSWIESHRRGLRNQRKRESGGNET